MKKYRFELVLALLSLGAFAALWIWLSPGGRATLTSAQVAAYIERIEPILSLPPPAKAEALARLRSWGEADDGAPVHMLNLMRFYETLQPVPGLQSKLAPFESDMTPTEANTYYEQAVMPLLGSVGGYPVIGGSSAGVRSGDGRRHSNLMVFDRGVDDWDRVLVVRYPNRRAFFELLSNPQYRELLPYKLAALQVALVPLNAEVAVPDPRWIVGLGLLALFFAVGWLRAVRRR